MQAILLQPSKKPDHQEPRQRSGSEQRVQSTKISHHSSEARDRMS